MPFCNDSFIFLHNTHFTTELSKFIFHTRIKIGSLHSQRRDKREERREKSEGRGTRTRIINSNTLCCHRLMPALVREGGTRKRDGRVVNNRLALLAEKRENKFKMLNAK